MVGSARSLAAASALPCGGPSGGPAALSASRAIGFLAMQSAMPSAESA